MWFEVVQTRPFPHSASFDATKEYVKCGIYLNSSPCFLSIQAVESLPLRPSRGARMVLSDDGAPTISSIRTQPASGVPVSRSILLAPLRNGMRQKIAGSPSIRRIGFTSSACRPKKCCANGSSTSSTSRTHKPCKGWYRSKSSYRDSRRFPSERACGRPFLTHLNEVFYR